MNKIKVLGNMAIAKMLLLARNESLKLPQKADEIRSNPIRSYGKNKKKYAEKNFCEFFNKRYSYIIIIKPCGIAF